MNVGGFEPPYPYVFTYLMRGCFTSINYTLNREKGIRTLEIF